DSVEVNVCFFERCVQSFGLGFGAWKAVEHEAVFGVFLLDALEHHADDHAIWDEVAALHKLIGLFTECGAGLDSGAQHVSGGDMWDGQSLEQLSGLGSFARTWRSNQDHAHDNVSSVGAAAPCKSIGDAPRRHPFR